MSRTAEPLSRFLDSAQEDARYALHLVNHGTLDADTLRAVQRSLNNAAQRCARELNAPPIASNAHRPSPVKQPAVLTLAANQNAL